MNKEKKRRTDRRTVYTKNAIKDSLLELLDIKDFAEITISELCRTADISRGTFYLHYSNTSDVLDELFADALGSTREMLVQIGCQAGPENTEGYPLCRFLRDNKKYQALFFSDSLRTKVIDRIAAAGLGRYLTYMRSETDLEDDILISLFYFQLNGCLAVSQKNISSVNSDWDEVQCAIDSFLRNGFENFKNNK